jgi:glycerol-3-phosphate acyltransferase PlsY
VSALQIAGFAGLMVLAYLVGSIPWGLVVGKVFYGTDVRRHGSGNVGTTNVFRVLGKKAGIAVFAADLLKGFIPAFIAMQLFDPWYAIFIAAAPEVGHMYSIFLKGSGGKGVATGAGIVLALVPLIFLACLLAWLVVLFTTRFVSLASITAAVLVPLLAFALGEPLPYRIAAVLVMIIVCFAHRGNIRRLLEGAENRVTFPWTRRGSPMTARRGRSRA